MHIHVSLLFCTVHARPFPCIMASEPSAQPKNVSTEHWKRFFELRRRREDECEADTSHRIEAVRQQALQNVSKELSTAEKKQLELVDGVSLPPAKRKRRRGHREPQTTASDKTTAITEAKWKEVKQYWEPNPQLRGTDLGRHAPKSGLEEELDKAVSEGEFNEAVKLSDRLAQRDLATKVATAFDCYHYVQNSKAEEGKKLHKKPKLHWKFEHKQRWETKGNM